MQRQTMTRGDLEKAKECLRLFRRLEDVTDAAKWRGLVASVAWTALGVFAPIEKALAQFGLPPHPAISSGVIFLAGMLWASTAWCFMLGDLSRRAK